jgi:chain length determinant protein EpsF
MNFRQILVVLRLRWWLVLSLFSICVVAAYVVTKRMPKQYTAEATVLLEGRTDPLLSTLMPSLASPGYVATQIEIIRSDPVTHRVVSGLGLATNTEALETWRNAAGGRVTLESFFGTILKRGLEVEPVRGSNLLSLKYTGSDPKFTSAVANAYAQAYMDVSRDLRVEPARQYNSFFDERLQVLRSEFEAAQSKLSAFQQRKGIVASEERVDLETARLNAIMGQLAGAQAELADTASRSRNTGLETSPDVQQSGVVQSLKSELARAETRLKEISSTLGSQHPQRLQLEAQIAELRQQTAAEMRRVSGATATVNRVASQKIGELTAMAETQKRNILALREQRDQMAVLQKDLETAQRAYEAVSQRRSQLSLESQVDQAAARILSPAVEPLYASKPVMSKNMLAAAVVGLLVGIAAVLGWELLDRRIRSADDLMVADGIPVLGVLSRKPGTAWRAPRAPRGPLQIAMVTRGAPQLTVEEGR